MDDDRAFFALLRQHVEEEIATYKRHVPDGSVASRMREEAVHSLLGEMRLCLVPPYWMELELRDTEEECDLPNPLMRKCTVVADDGKGFRLVHDPIEETFRLGQLYTGRWLTIGVDGNAVECFIMARNC
jgi:hypothetical protein